MAATATVSMQTRPLQPNTVPLAMQIPRAMEKLEGICILWNRYKGWRVRWRALLLELTFFLQAERFMASFEGGLLLPPAESSRSSPVPRQETSPPPLEPVDVEPSPRPDTVFERINQNASTVIEIEGDQTSEPPFVTDGRGRVVWSAVNNSDVQ